MLSDRLSVWLLRPEPAIQSEAQARDKVKAYCLAWVGDVGLGGVAAVFCALS